MDENKEKMALAAAQTNELHAAHENMACIGEDATGKVLVRCACGVVMAVPVEEQKPQVPAEPQPQPPRRKAREEGGE